MSIKQGSNYISGLQQDITSKANVSLNNLTATGKNIANWSSNVSNCITYIPQDIKLELNAGILTLKAGSKVYVPNGAGVFDEVVIPNDLTRTGWSYSGQFFLAIKEDATFSFIRTTDCYSGSSQPGSDGWWYDTTNNIIKDIASGSWTGSYKSFPLCIFSSDGTNITSIDQVFNGFGYIGSTVFALPGVKVLKPNWRNADGTLNNQSITLSTVKTRHNNGYTFNNFQIGINQDDDLTVGAYVYDPIYNIVIDANGTYCICGNIKGTSGRIDSIEVKTSFHALDYNDKEYIAHQAMPSDRYIDLTLGANGATYTAPADGYVLFVVNLGTFISISTDQLRVFSPGVGTDGQWYSVFCPVRKNKTFVVSYGGSIVKQFFRFVYATGAQ